MTKEIVESMALERYSTDDPDKKLLTYPTWPNDDFLRPQAVFGTRADDCSSDYSDRLVGYDRQCHEAAMRRADESDVDPNGQGWNSRTARWYQKYLEAYYNKSCRLICVEVAFKSNGYPHMVFHYVEGESEIPNEVITEVRDDARGTLSG